MIPRITSIRTTPDEFFATIDGVEVQLVTFRETLWLQQKVPLPPPFDERCEVQAIFNIPDDEDSDLMPVEGCVHQPQVAELMGKWAEGRLGNVTQKIN